MNKSGYEIVTVPVFRHHSGDNKRICIPIHLLGKLTPKDRNLYSQFTDSGYVYIPLPEYLVTLMSYRGWEHYLIENRASHERTFPEPDGEGKVKRIIYVDTQIFWFRRPRS